jgi:hypothetical protein
MVFVLYFEEVDLQHSLNPSSGVEFISRIFICPCRATGSYDDICVSTNLVSTLRIVQTWMSNTMNSDWKPGDMKKYRDPRERYERWIADNLCGPAFGHYADDTAHAPVGRILAGST